MAPLCSNRTVEILAEAVAWSRRWQRRLRAARRLLIAGAAVGVADGALSHDGYLHGAVPTVVAFAIAAICGAGAVAASRGEKRIRRTEARHFDAVVAAGPTTFPETLVVWPSTPRRRAVRIALGSLPGVLLLVAVWTFGYVGHHPALVALAAGYVGWPAIHVLRPVASVLYRGPSADKSPTVEVTREGITEPSWRLRVPWSEIVGVDVDFDTRTLRWRTTRRTPLERLIGWRARWQTALTDRIFADGGVSVRMPSAPEDAIWLSRTYMSRREDPRILTDTGVRAMSEGPVSGKIRGSSRSTR